MHFWITLVHGKLEMVVVKLKLVEFALKCKKWVTVQSQPSYSPNRYKNGLIAR